MTDIILIRKWSLTTVYCVRPLQGNCSTNWAIDLMRAP